MHVSPRQPSRVSVFAGDAFGAVVAALIALPYGLAMASLMGLPPWLGLVTSIATAPVTALLGRNPVLIGGTASATGPFIAHAGSPPGLGVAAEGCLAGPRLPPPASSDSTKAWSAHSI